MTKTRKIAIIVCVWIASGALTSGFINANFRAEFPDLLQSPRWAAATRNRSIVFSVTSGPFGLFFMAIGTGLFYDGWTLRGDAAPCKTDHPEIWCK